MSFVRQLIAGAAGRLARWPQRARHSTIRRGRMDHVIVLDGTLSSLVPGHETNVGLIYRLMEEIGMPVSVYYEAGIQWEDWKSLPDVITGRGIHHRIRRAYGWLASRYRPGDRIFLFGYSRGAYSVRSLAGMIDVVGLLDAKYATERNVTQAWRHYERRGKSKAAKAFVSLYCHPEVQIEMIGAFETVRALGTRIPILRHYTDRRYQFHNHHLGKTIKHGCHALALNETRRAFRPVLWETGSADERARVTQMWFRGTHGDIGGQLSGDEKARPLSNIPLVWMLEQAEACGLALPPGWKLRFPTSSEAPSVGTWRRWGKIFFFRGRRQVGADPSEALHSTVPRRLRGKHPRVWANGRRLSEIIE